MEFFSVSSKTGKRSVDRRVLNWAATPPPARARWPFRTSTIGKRSRQVTWLLWIPLAWLILVLGILLWHRRELIALWHEPVLKHPVLILESDDWGAGPVEPQAEALNRLVDLLTQYKDCTGHPPVMTLGLVLAVPDGPAIRATGRYHRITLEHPMFVPLLAAIERGRKAGVFVLQLHGMEHYWPDALMASQDPAVRVWLEADPPAATEQLPSHLQSRWTDASVLPSRPLPPEEIARAVHEEVLLFERVFGERPRVAVPPTFVWSEAVEAAWAREGIEVVITPGLRSACRNAAGLPDCDTAPLCNGQRGAGVGYIVRDDYFEPERGHTAAQALTALAAKQTLGRPCLLEIHRSNFLGADLERSLHQVQGLCRGVQEQGDVRFLTPLRLDRILRDNDPEWLTQDRATRMKTWLARCRQHDRFFKLARLVGLWPVMRGWVAWRTSISSA